MKKIILASLLIFTLCGCSAAENVPENTQTIAASYSCAGADILLNKCGYEIREGTPVKPILKNMPTDELPSIEKIEWFTSSVDPDTPNKTNDSEPQLLLLNDGGTC